MRAAEFLKALIDLVDKGELPTDDGDEKTADVSEPFQNPVFVSPLQQELELSKADQGKESPVIDKITQKDNLGFEPEQRKI